MCAVRTGNEIVVIDSLHSPGAAEKALKKIQKNFPGFPVGVVINTHGHHDHTFGNQVFKNAKIYGHQNTGHWMILSRELPGAAVQINNEAKLQLTPPEFTITRPEVVVAGGVKIFLIPFGNAHSSSDLLIAIPGKRVLFVGDLFFPKGFPKFNRYRGNEWWPGEWSPEHWIRSIELVFSLGTYDHVVPGHGKCFQSERIRLWYDYFLLLKKRVLSLVQAGLVSKEIIERLESDRSFKALFEKLDFPEFPAGHHRVFIREFSRSYAAVKSG